MPDMSNLQECVESYLEDLKWQEREQELEIMKAKAKIEVCQKVRLSLEAILHDYEQNKPKTEKET